MAKKKKEEKVGVIRRSNGQRISGAGVDHRDDDDDDHDHDDGYNEDDGNDDDE